MRDLAKQPIPDTPPLSDRVYLTRRQAAQYLGRSVRHIDDLFKRGAIPRIKTPGGPNASVAFRRADLDAYLERHVEVAS